MNKQALNKAVAFLNANFKPWEFCGDEPVALALATLLCEVSEEAVTDAVSRGLIGSQTPALGCRIESA